MNQRTPLACLVGTAAALVMLLAPGKSLASASFPEQIQLTLNMPCPPPCTICHKSQEGGAGTTKPGFASAMVRPGNLVATAPETVAPALTAVQAAMPPIDSDGDGAFDVAELQAMRDPNTPAADGDELICPPTYGCGARIAARPPVDGSAFICALFVAGYLALRSRKSA